MVDPLIAQALVRNINILLRKRSKPHGTTDHFYRGTRMSYNRAHRTLIGLLTLGAVLLAATAFLFLPGILQDKDGMALCGKIVATGLAIIGVLGSLQAFCEFVIVNDYGLLKSNLFGRKTKTAWDEILHFNVKPDDNKVIFFGKDKFKLTMSLSYNGWQDFLEMAERRLETAKYKVFAYTLANVDAKRPQRKTFWNKPLFTKRAP
jgi:hypothetical protein